MPKGRPYRPKRTSSSPRRSSDSSSRRQGGRAYKGSDSLHKPAGQIMGEIRSMRSSRSEDSPGWNALTQGNRKVGSNLAGRIARGQASKRKGSR